MGTYSMLLSFMYASSSSPCSFWSASPPQSYAVGSLL